MPTPLSTDYSNSSTPARAVGRESNARYVAFHAPRFAFLIDVLRRQMKTPNPRILDVGPSHLTTVMADAFKVPIDSLGLEQEATLPTGHHYHVDLNAAQNRERWRLDFGPYDVVVFAEVIEHLYTAPELVLAYLRELLVPGGLLAVQTPNAVSLRKRVQLLLGRNPAERIRLDTSNPGHFREYTALELDEILRATGFQVRGSWTKFYFDARFARHETGQEAPSTLKGSVKNFLYGSLPSALREGITVVATKNE